MLDTKIVFFSLLNSIYKQNRNVTIDIIASNLTI